ncbi:hypothetical protein ACWOEF_17060 [Enterococcus crotali]
MVVGSFGSILILLFFQGTYKGDHTWKMKCDRQYLENQKEPALRSQSRSKSNK